MDDQTPVEFSESSMNAEGHRAMNHASLGVLERTRRIDRWPQWAVSAAACAAIAVTLWFDWMSGPRLSMLLFYSLATAGTAWSIGVRRGVLAALASSTAATLVRLLHDAATSSASEELLNAVLRAGSLALLAVLVTRQRRVVDELNAASRRDGLTGLLNRAALLAHAEQEVARARRSAQPLTVAFFDLDGLKETNDHHGHDSGDELLQQFAAVVSSRLRTTDVLGRVGGDEFVALLPDTDPGGARHLIEPLMAQRNLPAVSCGVVVLRSNEDATTLISRADAAMYQAKAAQCGLVVVEH